jgi:hypothetical protein
MKAQELNEIVKQAVAECTDFFKAQGWVPDDWCIRVTTDFSPRRNRSWGGTRHRVPFISLALHRFTGTNVASFHEYRSFQHDPEIGSVNNNTINAVRATVAHEACHAVQHSCTTHASAAIGEYDSSGHGAMWKEMYRRTRRALGLVRPTTGMTEVKRVKRVIATPTQNNTSMIKRPEAMRIIASLKHTGHSNRTIIDVLVNQHGLKKTTATTYTYSVPTAV